MCVNVVPLSSVPSRPLRPAEIDKLKEADRVSTILYDDEHPTIVGPDPFVYNCILITDRQISAIVFDDEKEQWFQVGRQEFSQSADLDRIYSAVQQYRNNDSIFSRSPKTVKEAMFIERREAGNLDIDASEGDSFDCPICEQSHVIKRENNSTGSTSSAIDLSHYYVECSATRNNHLIVQYSLE